MSELDLAQDLAESAKIKRKAQLKSYAHKLYAALSNTTWQHNTIMSILRDQTWSSSWRSTGAIVAGLRGAGEDYLDWYCSGHEGVVHPEIQEDLAELGWCCIDNPRAELPEESMWGERTGIAGALDFNKDKQ